jgi:hypothetical protein
LRSSPTRETLHNSLLPNINELTGCAHQQKACSATRTKHQALTSTKPTMNNKSHIQIALLLGSLAAGTVQLYAQGTIFTYQGSLKQNGTAVTGTQDFEFRLFTAASGGVQVGSVVTFDDAGVTNGLFTAPLDFGAAFDGTARFLEIAVRPGTSTGSYMVLAPRQLITATPYAVRALQAAAVPVGTITSAMLADGAVTGAKIAPGALSQLGSPDGSPATALQVNTNGLVGIGTNAPSAGLHITASQSFLNPEVLSVRIDGSDSYTNLKSVSVVAVQGTLVAVASSGYPSGITLMDVTDPSAPILLSQVRDGDGVFTNLAGASGLAMKSNLLAIASFSAVTLVDVSDPANPVKLAVLRDGVGGWNELGGLTTVAISGNLMVITAGGDAAVTLADITNPAVPVKRVEITDGVFGFDSLSYPSSATLSGNLLAVASPYDSAVTLIDVANPSNPVKRAELRNGVNGFDLLNYASDVALSGNLLAIASPGDNAVTLVNVSDPANPVKLGEWKDDVNADALNGVARVAFSSTGSQLAASASGDRAVTLFDVTDVAHPTVVAVARQGTGGFNYLFQVSGVAFAGNNLVIASSPAVTVAGIFSRSTGLSSAGWVGIGTTRPAGALHVVGDMVVEQANRIELNTVHFQVGLHTIGSGYASTATGIDTTASDYASTAMGIGTTASGQASTAMGSGTTASGQASTAMGTHTTASGTRSTATGIQTVASGDFSTAMGLGTTASGIASAAMGSNTMASGDFSTAMGADTRASGEFSTAMGQQARAIHRGTFVWGDSVNTGVFSTATNQFTTRASGGYRLFSNAGLAGVSLAPDGTAWGVISDRNQKKDFAPVDQRAVLEKLAALPLTQWHYLWEDAGTTPHLGPMAQDFKAAFYPGTDDKTITTQEADGVALAAIQGLNQKLEAEVKSKDIRLAELEKRLAALEVLLQK